MVHDFQDEDALMVIIDTFSGEHRFLSNFHPSPVHMYGDVYPTVEHAYQAAKSNDPAVRAWVREAFSPGQAKRMGRKIDLRPDWQDIKFSVMYTLVTRKFQGNQDLHDLLLATGDAELVEGNTWNDTYWGVCNGVGENYLGKILMQVRANLESRPK